MFGGNFAPRGWALCDGQLLPIAQNQALFAILGTTFGGDGRTTFALPDLRGRFPLHKGTGPGLPPYGLGQRGGAENHTLTVSELPSHNHFPQCSSGAADSDSPVAAYPSVDEGATESFSTTSNSGMGATGNTGGGQTFSIQNPYLAVNFIIALEGTFPSRN